MKYANVTLLVMASTISSVALAQDGGGHGPPRSPIIIAVPQPTPVPRVPVPKLLQPRLDLPSTSR